MVDAVSVISVAFRVAQLTSSFTRRIRTRIETNPQPLEATKIKDDLCNEWDRLKNDEIDHYLRRRPVRSKTESSTPGFTQNHIVDAAPEAHIAADDTNLGEDDALEAYVHHFPRINCMLTKSRLLGRLKQPNECEHSSLSYLAKHDKAYF